MFGFGEAKEHRDTIYNGEPHEANWTHELIGGGAAFEAMKLFEDKQRKEGKPVEHAFAKELIAGIAGAEVDKLVETKGLDFVDKEKAQHHAKQNAMKLYEDQYAQHDNFDPSAHDRPEY